MVVSHLGSHVAMPGEQQKPLQDGSAKKKKLCVNAESCSIKSPNLNKGHLAARSISREIKIARG